VGGMISREACEDGTRVGFEILDLSSGRSGWLVHVNQNLDGLSAQAVIDAVENCDVIDIDEVGPIELFSNAFKEAVRKALESRKPVLAILHWTAKDRMIDEAKRREDSETYNITQENRNKLPETLAQETRNLLK
jgi:nucleoside-triphosphatase